MDEFSNVQENEIQDKRETIKQKLRQYYDGRIVRKDLTKSIREGANVPVYVLEYLLGQYCNSDDEEIIEEGVENVKRILRDNYVRPDEAQKILSLLRERGSYTVIDRITVVLNTKEDRYEATFSNLGVKGIPIHPDYVKDYDRLLCGGIWCILQMEYEFIEEDKKNTQPIHIRKLTPIQMPHVDMDEVKNGRKAFTKEEWMDVLLRSTGMELCGKNMGILGLGAIGKVVAKCAQGFSMQVLAYDPRPQPEYCDAHNIRAVSFETLLRESDVVSLHLPLTQQTKRMISQPQLEWMKPGALLINASRGGIVDEDAAFSALQEGKLGGLGLDAFEHEPPEGNPLLQLDNVIATPHTGAHTKEAVSAMAELAVRNLVQMLREGTCFCLVK